MSASDSRTISVLPDKQGVAGKAAEEFVRASREAIDERGMFCVALSGGSTPVSMYKHLVDESMVSEVEWQRVIFFWSDERCVPPDHPDSNYGAAARELIEHLDVPEANVHRMKGEIEPRIAAREYEADVRQWVHGDPPRFDLLLLGMGDDGHTASLFPGTPAVQEYERLVTENYVPKLEANRISFTRTLINAASEVIVLVTGKEKAEALKAVLEGPRDEDKYPAQIIAPGSGNVLWLADNDAAQRLSNRS